MTWSNAFTCPFPLPEQRANAQPLKICTISGLTTMMKIIKRLKFLLIEDQLLDVEGVKIW